MATINKSQPSLLDKLIDSDPSSTHDFDYPRTMQSMWSSLIRDLEDLLNTRVGWHTIDPNYHQLNNSIVNYGLPDFSSMPFSSDKGQELLCEMVRSAIKKHEPRLQHVNVELSSGKSPIDRVLKLRITATVAIDEQWHDLSFDTEVEPVNLGFKLRRNR